MSGLLPAPQSALASLRALIAQVEETPDPILYDLGFEGPEELSTWLEDLHPFITDVRMLASRMDNDTKMYLQQLKRSLQNIPAEGVEFEEYVGTPESTIENFMNDKGGLPHLRNLKEHFVTLITTVYGLTRRRSPQTARRLFSSWLEDYPGVPGSRVLSQWSSLVRAGHATRTVSTSEDENLILQQLLEVHQAFNEFFNSLLPFLICSLEAAAARSHNVQCFRWNYFKKIKRYEELIKPYHRHRSLLFFREVTRHLFRNSIAHADVELRKDLGVIRFNVVESGNPTTVDIKTQTFVEMAALYSQLAHAYLTALAVIAVFEEGDQANFQRLPQRVQNSLK